MADTEKSTKEIDITQDPNIWVFRSREVPIDEMDKKSVLCAAIHAMKRMYYHNKQVHYSDYRIKIAKSDEEIAKWERTKKKSSDIMLKFAEKLDSLENRALELGFEIPDDYEKVKDLRREHEKELAKQ